MAFVAQTSGSAGDITNVATLITQIGLSAVFLWLWFTERKERQETQQSNLRLLERALPALAEATEALDRVQSVLNTQIERSTPDGRAVDIALRRLELMADELGSTLRTTRRHKEERDDA